MAFRKAKSAHHPIFTLSDRLEETLADSITGKAFSDVSFYAFSQRIAPGKVGKPQMVLANSKVLRSTSPYFRACKSSYITNTCPHVTYIFAMDHEKYLQEDFLNLRDALILNRSLKKQRTMIMNLTAT